MENDRRIAELESRLSSLEAEREILRTLYAYGHSIDYGDERRFADCWLQDATLHWPWRRPLEGHAAIIDAFRAHTHAPDAYHKHLMVEPRIAVSGDRAQVESMYARLDRGLDGKPFLRSFGRYRDTLRRCSDGRWRFAERRAENEAHVSAPQSEYPPSTSIT